MEPGEIVSAGVDPNHQTTQCDHCGHVFEEGEERTATCTQKEYVTLCESCYKKAGNSVR